MYELKNFNRQYGANMQTVGRDKIEVMKEEALSINPQCQIETFNKGINEDNLDKFFENVDLAVDGIDFFEVEIRRKFFNRALKLEIPVITAGPMGFSTAFLIFMPGGPNFDEYFAVDYKSTDGTLELLQKHKIPVIKQDIPGRGKAFQIAAKKLYHTKNS